MESITLASGFQSDLADRINKIIIPHSEDMYVRLKDGKVSAGINN